MILQWQNGAVRRILSERAHRKQPLRCDLEGNGPQPNRETR
jgi:hypothetical protein